MELPSPELMLVLVLRFVALLLPFKKLGLDGKGMDSIIPSSQKFPLEAALDLRKLFVSLQHFILRSFVLVINNFT